MSKRQFVNETLYFTLYDAIDNFIDVRYHQEGGLEAIIIVMKSGEYWVNVTGDSLIAIVKDVASFIIRRL